ncbi:hypothetical protein AYL99_10464 [Fonsecaea erecta]|uniref:fumarylacetoacetase n=1 Tax=Fonsecaea erecta TaxID=1367422 RepID=A0A178Z7M0_9EURO|nr:hypothetical protein AYL99_10464 [Fonsecaea erecta]OAP55491.1 hypothetical protein AYL99_10464 [Fonsecaea erecta]
MVLKSWLDVPEDHDFSIENLPFGIFSTADNVTPRPGIAIGRFIVDLSALVETEAFSMYCTCQFPYSVLKESALNSFAALGRETVNAVRMFVKYLLVEMTPIMRDNKELRQKCIIDTAAVMVEMHLPMKIGDFSDFLNSRTHAKNTHSTSSTPVNMFNPPRAFTGRASSLVVSGTPIVRPLGHLIDSSGKAYVGPSQQMDVEMEFAFFIGEGIKRFERVSIEEAEKHIFGVVLLNDWSTRDVQAPEDHPFAAFNAKSFASTISPWVVSIDALEAYRTKAQPQEPSDLLPYLTDKKELGTFDISIHMEWRLSPEEEVFATATSNLTNAYWSFAQMLTHHAFGGCEMRTGDLLGTGTITGEANSGINQLSGRAYTEWNTGNPDACGKQEISACRLDQGPPCYACRLYARECIISERPPRKRQKSTSEAGRAAASSATAHDTGVARPPHTDVPRSSNWTQGAQAAVSANNDVDLAVFSPQSNGSSQQMSPTHGGGSVTSQVSVESGRPTTRQAVVGREHDVLTESLDAWPTKTTFLLGDTGESDPYLLRHFSSEYLDSSVDDIAKATPRHMLRASDPDVMHSQGKPLVVLIADHSLYDRGEPRLDQHVLDQAADEVSQMVSDETGVRLVKLFFRYIYPYFPILSKTRLLYPLAELPARLKTLPLSLKAAIYASALAFFTYDDVLATTIVHSPPSSQRLYRIAWVAVTHEVHTPHLSTLQSCLLLLQRVNDDRYVMDTVFRWSLLGWTVALAQSFGLSTDCQDWTGLPEWEKRLRRRLWWATFVMDKWAFMSAGLTSHIHDDNYDVAPLTAADFIYSDETDPSRQPQHGGGPEGIEPPLSHFYHLTRLTAILSDIQTAFFTVAASKRTERDFRLSIDLAKPIRRRLKEWKTAFDSYLDTRNLPSHQSNSTATRSRSSGLDGDASLGLSYLVTNIILFRALLRPLESNLPSSSSSSSSSEAGRDAVRTGARTCCVEAVAFVESLRRNVWDAFWHSWSRAGFAMLSSMMIRLLITSTDAGEVDDVNALIRRWRWALRTGGGSAGNVLMSLALLRLDRSLVTRGIHESDEE